MDAQRQPKSIWDALERWGNLECRRDGTGEGVAQAGPFGEEPASTACTREPTSSYNIERNRRIR